MRDIESTRAQAYVWRLTKTPVGELKLVGSDRGLAAILWENDRVGRVRLNMVRADPSHPVLLETEQQLHQYFSRERQVFDVRLDFVGTAFQKAVWRALLTIPFGATRSYADIAKQLQKPLAVRAVGAANGKNPISIRATCHRVIGAKAS